PSHYGLVLALLVGAYVLSAFVYGTVARAAVGALYLVALVVAVRASRPGRRLRLVVRVIVIAGAVVLVVAPLVLSKEATNGVTDVVLAVVLASAVVCILDRILTEHDVTVQLIGGALSAYLMVGMFFASVFGVMDWLQSDEFFASGERATAESLQYFSFVTLTTLGYGDLTSVSSSGRALSALEALVGQVFLATLIARLVGSFRRPVAATPDPEAGEDPT
ncbi:MAG: potassium channel family protein, partial [Brevundimonas sp.]